MHKDVKELNVKAEKYSETIDSIREEIKKVIVGQEEIIDKVLLALLANGHVLLEGVPGLAKTLLVQTLADTLEGDFTRLQFTPDLLPADIIGTNIYDSGKFKTVKGPIFTNFVLADEINRAPPKVQSALLEAMQERQVSIQGNTFKLDSPFLVLATQNPIESEGTYNLPEAQIDRFMIKILINHPSKDEEKLIIQRFTQGTKILVKKQLSIKKILEIQQFVNKIYVDETITEYVAEIVDATRNPENYGLEIGTYIDCGASPRASIWLILGAKANALMQGRGYVIPEDVQEIVYEVLRHRIIKTYEAEAEEITSDDLIKQLIEKIKVP